MSQAIVPIHQAKTNLSQLVKRAAGGERILIGSYVGQKLSCPLFLRVLANDWGYWKASSPCLKILTPPCPRKSLQGYACCPGHQ